MVPAKHLVDELRSLDSRLGVIWNPEVERWEVRMRLTEAQCALEGLAPLVAIPHGAFMDGNLIELVPFTFLVKRIATATGEFVPFDRAVVDYIRRLDTHRFDSADQWMDQIEAEGRAEMERHRAKTAEDRRRSVRSDWESRSLDRQHFDYGRGYVST